MSQAKFQFHGLDNRRQLGVWAPKRELRTFRLSFESSVCLTKRKNKQVLCSDKSPSWSRPPRGNFKLVEPLSECEATTEEAVPSPSLWPRKHRRLPCILDVIQNPAAPLAESQ